MYKNKKTFTLIEMLIVIVIIGILAAALIPRLQGAQERTRDIKRKADLKNLTHTVRLFFSDNGVYPQPANYQNYYMRDSANSATNPTDYISGVVPTYISSLPLDPINNGPIDPYVEGYHNYIYGRVTKNPNGFDLIGQLENKKDPDRCGVRRYKRYFDNADRCGPNTTYSDQIYQYYDDGFKE